MEDDATEPVEDDTTEPEDDTTEATPGTCEGSCGGISADESCYCDALCKENGNCCPDVDEFCEELTCVETGCPENTYCIEEAGSFECMDFCAADNGGCVDLDCSPTSEGAICLCPANATWNQVVCNSAGEENCDTPEDDNCDGMINEDCPEQTPTDALPPLCECNPTFDSDELGGCSCPLGFAQEEDTCIDVNECESGEVVCDSGFTCANQPGLATCLDINECVVSPEVCGPNSICENSTGSYGCACNPGHENVDGVCADVDECSPNGPSELVCSEVDVLCDDLDCTVAVNALDPFCDEDNWDEFCVACAASQPGYQGLDCSGVGNACVSDGNPCGDTAFWTCENTPGSFTCTDMDECLVGNGGCADVESCVNVTGGAPECLCDKAGTYKIRDVALWWLGASVTGPSAAGPTWGYEAEEAPFVLEKPGCVVEGGAVVCTPGPDTGVDANYEAQADLNTAPAALAGNNIATGEGIFGAEAAFPSGEYYLRVRVKTSDIDVDEVIGGIYVSGQCSLSCFGFGQPVLWFKGSDFHKADEYQYFEIPFSHSFAMGFGSVAKWNAKVLWKGNASLTIDSMYVSPQNCAGYESEAVGVSGLLDGLPDPGTTGGEGTGWVAPSPGCTNEEYPGNFASTANIDLGQTYTDVKEIRVTNGVGPFGHQGTGNFKLEASPDNVSWTEVGKEIFQEQYGASFYDGFGCSPVYFATAFYEPEPDSPLVFTDSWLNSNSVRYLRITTYRIQYACEDSLLENGYLQTVCQESSGASIGEVEVILEDEQGTCQLQPFCEPYHKRSCEASSIWYNEWFFTTDICGDSSSPYLEQGAECLSVETDDGYEPQCGCQDGYVYVDTGSWSEIGCKPVDPCLDNNAGCGDPKDYKCVITPGIAPYFECAGVKNECEDNNGGCAQYALCTDEQFADPLCACPSGFTGDGYNNCTDIDECATNNPCWVDTAFVDCKTTCSGTYTSLGCDAYCLPPGTQVTQVANAQCQNTIGGFECTCGPGTVGDGVTCARCPKGKFCTGGTHQQWCAQGTYNNWEGAYQQAPHTIKNTVCSTLNWLGEGNEMCRTNDVTTGCMTCSQCKYGCADVPFVGEECLAGCGNYSVFPPAEWCELTSNTQCNSIGQETCY